MKLLSHDIIRRPIITEKSMAAMQDKKYTFIVDRRADKTEIKNAVEEVFGVKVEKVDTMIVHGKPKRVGMNFGKRSDYKKAIVKLTEDSKAIEFFEGM